MSSLDQTYLNACELYLAAKAKGAHNGAALTPAVYRKRDLSPLLWIAVAAISLGSAIGDIAYTHHVLAKVQKIRADIASLERCH